MRRFLTSKPVKFFGFTTTAVAVASAASFGGWGSGNKGKLSSFRNLDATEFNAIQDTVALQASLAKLPKFDANNDEILTLYAMRGCPFCARVRSILTFYGIPFEEVVIDPILGKELAEHPYKSVPQVQFRKKNVTADGIHGVKNPRPASDKTKEMTEEEVKALHARPAKREDYVLLTDGPMIVDSECIVRALSVPLKFDKDLETREISDPREDMANQFQRYVYVSTHATWSRATSAMKTETDPKFQVFPLNWVGGLVLYLIATKKVLQRALAATTLTFAPDATPAQKSDKMLFEYLKGFAAEREKEKYGFKDGKAFNIIDVEMHGVLSQVHTLPHVEQIIKESGAEKWWERIDSSVKNHEGKQRLLK